MELLAPVNADTLQAALDAGADAVYFGLTRLNARRGAKNFAPDELSGVVADIHAAGAKAHLTVNIDLATRELGLAARTLQLASEAAVDAVIVRDAAILALRPLFPQLQFHLSTQAGIASSAGVWMAKELGCDRVVLAREMTREEIGAASSVPGMETEVFVQGAMCFCCSGRCLLSSWVGGRSGNRGTCASPCRVAWKPDGASATAHPMSMHDLCLLERLDELREMGVASLKIEGRLKSATWVARAVALYRKALDHAAEPAALREEAEALGYYTGRTLTTAYFDCHFDHLTDEDAGRQATPAAQGCQTTPENSSQVIDNQQLKIIVSAAPQGGTNFTFVFGTATQTLRIPWQRVPNPRRALRLGSVLAEATSQLPRSQEYDIECPDELRKLLLPRRCVATVGEALLEFLRQGTKEDDGQVRIPLPPEIAHQLSPQQPPSAANVHCLNEPPDRFRVDARLLGKLAALPAHATLVLELPPDGLPQGGLPEAGFLAGRQLVLALPQVAYEGDFPRLRAALALAKAHSWRVEVNSWDTLQLAREANAPFEAGPGLAVLNPLAARLLHSLGAEVCTVSPEIDQEKFAALCHACEIPLSAVVFARPALMTTRAVLPEGFAPPPGGQQPGLAFADARGTRLRAWAADGLTVLRPVTPYDWRHLSSPGIRVAHLMVDLCGSPDPASDLLPAKSPFLFNFDRTLR